MDDYNVFNKVLDSWPIVAAGLLLFSSKRKDSGSRQARSLRSCIPKKKIEIHVLPDENWLFVTKCSLVLMYCNYGIFIFDEFKSGLMAA